MSKKLLILNEFEAKALEASFPTEPSIDFIFDTSERIWASDVPEERLLSLYHLHKITFDKYDYITEESFVSRLEELSDDLLWNFKNCIDCYEGNVYNNNLFVKFIDILKNDNDCMSRLFMISTIEDEIETLGLHLYFLTENTFFKNKIKNEIINIICDRSETVLLNFKNCSDSFKEALFEEAKEQFILDFNPKGL